MLGPLSIGVGDWWILVFVWRVGDPSGANGKIQSLGDIQWVATRAGYGDCCAAGQLLGAHIGWRGAFFGLCPH